MRHVTSPRYAMPRQATPRHAPPRPADETRTAPPGPANQHPLVLILTGRPSLRRIWDGQAGGQPVEWNTSYDRPCRQWSASAVRCSAVQCSMFVQGGGLARLAVCGVLYSPWMTIACLACLVSPASSRLLAILGLYFPPRWLLAHLTAAPLGCTAGPGVRSDQGRQGFASSLKLVHVGVSRACVARVGL